ncbi:hypothetical protein HDU93_009162 [Gonapodya sp. JEL0774]|nr:hypothetical protein HDU93_009162 [Gonapodya sp. JEL0774]
MQHTANTNGAARRRQQQPKPQTRNNIARIRGIRARRAMSTTRNVLLIEAVENGQAQRVRQLLSEGANPNARKRVTLTCKIGRETETDSVECESALALGILHAHEEVVKALLDGGADPNGACEWKTSNCSNWMGLLNADSWTDLSKRWVGSYLFPSPLTLAVARGGKWMNWDGSTSNPAPDSDNKLAINLKGGSVQLRQPRVYQDACISPFALQPSLPILQVLLSHGAAVTQRELDAACKWPDQLFLQALQHHQFHPPTSVPAHSQHSPSAPASPSPTSQSTETFLALLTNKDREIIALRAELDQVKGRNEELSVRTAVAESKVEEVMQRNVEHQARITNLEAANQDLQTQNYALSTKNDTLSAEIRTLSTKNAALEREIGNLAQLTSLPPEPPTREPQPPRTVKKLMHAIAEYFAQDTDELDVAVGDEIYVNLEFADGWGFVSATISLLAFYALPLR